MEEKQKKNYRPNRKPSAFAKNEQLEDKTDLGIVEGKNAVLEALNAGREIDKIFFASGSIKTVGHIIAKARQAGVPTQECDRRKLDQMSSSGAHQGIVAMCAAAQYRQISDMLILARSRGQKPLIILCDGITDSHNLGAIIRSAEVAGAHGVIIPRRRSAGLNAACAKAAAGALEHLPVAKCANIQQAVIELHKSGLFIFAADMDGTPMHGVDLDMPCAVIIGAEGEGISQLAKKESDKIISIPQLGHIPSLNASNAAAVLLYEIQRQRMGWGANT